jgi:hypothetical protein
MLIAPGEAERVCQLPIGMRALKSAPTHGGRGIDPEPIGKSHFFKVLRKALSSTAPRLRFSLWHWRIV